MKNTKNTSDVYMASLFLAKGAQIQDVDKDDPRHMIFYFDADDEGMNLDKFLSQ